jgi:hypothetical protein
MAEAPQRGLDWFAPAQFEEAICCFEEYLRHAGTSEVWNNWAMAHFASGCIPKLREDLKREPRLDPRNIQAVGNLRVLAASSIDYPGKNQQKDTRGKTHV